MMLMMLWLIPFFFFFKKGSIHIREETLGSYLYIWWNDSCIFVYFKNYLLTLECEYHLSAYAIQLRIYLPKTLGFVKLAQAGCGEPGVAIKVVWCVWSGCWCWVLLQAHRRFALCLIPPDDLVIGPEAVWGLLRAMLVLSVRLWSWHRGGREGRREG